MLLLTETAAEPWRSFEALATWCTWATRNSGSNPANLNLQFRAITTIRELWHKKSVALLIRKDHGSVKKSKYWGQAKARPYFSRGPLP